MDWINVCSQRSNRQYMKRRRMSDDHRVKRFVGHSEKSSKSSRRTHRHSSQIDPTNNPYRTRKRPACPYIAIGGTLQTFRRRCDDRPTYMGELDVATFGEGLPDEGSQAPVLPVLWPLPRSAKEINGFIRSTYRWFVAFRCSFSWGFLYVIFGMGMFSVVRSVWEQWRSEEFSICWKLLEICLLVILYDLHTNLILFGVLI